MKSPTIGVWSPSLRTVADRVRNASGRVKVWTQERSTHTAYKRDKTKQSANPIYILALITLGIPALLLIPLVGMNPGVQDGTFVTVLSFLVLSAFVTAAVFEVKRLVDQPSDESPTERQGIRLSLKAPVENGERRSRIGCGTGHGRQAARSHPPPDGKAFSSWFAA